MILKTTGRYLVERLILNKPTEVKPVKVHFLKEKCLFILQKRKVRMQRQGGKVRLRFSFFTVWVSADSQGSTPAEQECCCLCITPGTEESPNKPGGGRNEHSSQDAKRAKVFFMPLPRYPARLN